MKFIDKEHQIEMRDAWLSEAGFSRKDVMSDDKGEYVLLDPELMDEGEEEVGNMKKVYLPKELNEDYTPF